MSSPIKPEPSKGKQLPESNSIELHEKQRLEKEIENYLSLYLEDCLSSLEDEGESGYFL